jgi:hypothetical protein
MSPRLIIGPYLVSEGNLFPTILALVYTSSVNRAIIKARLNRLTHVLYELRAYTTIYAIHVHS